MQQYLLPIFLFAHVLGAIITFGPAFASPLIARQARRMPQSGHFAAVLGQVIQSRIIIPGAIVQGITGVGLILIMGVDLTSSPWRWLVVAIVLYLVTITFAIAVQREESPEWWSSRERWQAPPEGRRRQARRPAHHPRSWRPRPGSSAAAC
jgi:uncharacterized membrane protein